MIKTTLHIMQNISYVLCNGICPIVRSYMNQQLRKQIPKMKQESGPKSSLSNTQAKNYRYNNHSMINKTEPTC